MSCVSIWFDLPAIGSFVAMSYYIKLYAKEDDCEMVSLSLTSIVIMLMSFYSVMEHGIINVIKKKTKHDKLPLHDDTYTDQVRLSAR